MVGEPIDALKAGVQILLDTLRQDPYALETTWISVITFASEARLLTPLTELMQFKVPELRAGGYTSMGAALELLADRIAKDVVKASPSHKGDWKPMVFLLGDGVPTDEIQAGIAALEKVVTGVVVACAAGPMAKPDAFRQVTENVVTLDLADFNYIKAFFKWVSASIATSSRKIETHGNAVASLGELPPPPAEVKPV
jgi:uncharacterized protein YegL